MSHYEERLERDLSAIRERIADMATHVAKGLADAIHALQTGDHRLAAQTILADHPINRTMREIDRLCHAFIAVHLPSAGHLRLLSAAIRINIALERIGDYAVTIARVSEQMPTPPEGQMARELERIANEAKVMLGQAIKAFNALNADTARATMIMEHEMELDLDAIYAELMANSEREKVKNLLATFIVFIHLKRVADQAKNLCEETVFAVTGETKAPKVYNILFLDQDNACLAPMAKLIAESRFPGSGNYANASPQPAAGLNQAMVSFLEERGIDVSKVQPQSLNLTQLELAEKHLVISLQGPVRSYLPILPFHTTGVEWELELPPEGIDGLKTAADFEAIYRQIASEVSDLMEILRGKDAP